MTVAGETNTKINYNVLTKGNGNMCTLFEEIAKEAEMKGEIKSKLHGKSKGIVESGLDFGLSESDILDRLQKKLNISLQVANEYLQMFKK